MTRDEITDYLAEVADATPITANRDLAILSALMSWYERQRGSGFTSPIVKGMRPADEPSRTRILADEEIRVVWHVAGRTGVYGAIVRELLLLAARRNEVAQMRRTQIGDDGIWTLPGDLTKNHEPLFLPLSADALSVIQSRPVRGDNDLVFSPDGKRLFTSWSHSKRAFDRRVHLRLQAIARAKGDNPSSVAPLPNWTLHDLRRTARSLMSRAKVRPDHAERVLNHKIAGVEGIYNRHTYEDEKRDALERLSRLLRQIVAGETAKVVQFPARINAG